MRASEVGAAALGIAIGLGVLLVASELALRVYTHFVLHYDVEMTRYSNRLKEPSPDPRIGHVHRPGAEAVLMGVPVAINSAGLRDSEIPVERSGARRIAFLGDSLTFGWGVAREDTFEYRIERGLSQREPTEILNFGTGNYNTEQQVNRFLEIGLEFRPDEVVVFFFINDAEPTPHRSRWAFLGHSRAATFLWSRVKAVRSRLLASRSYEEYYTALYGDQQPGWLAAQQAFLDLQRVCRERGMGLRVVLLPELHAPARLPFAEQHGKVVAFLEAHGIEAYDLAPAFADETDPLALWVALDDAHPNARAHQKIAALVLPWLAQPARGR